MIARSSQINNLRRHLSLLMLKDLAGGASLFGSRTATILPPSLAEVLCLARLVNVVPRRSPTLVSRKTELKCSSGVKPLVECFCFMRAGKRFFSRSIVQESALWLR